MSAFRGGMRQGDGRYHEKSLMKLVEEYLQQNRQHYYVNFEQMGEVICKKSFRYARMKPCVFKQQLKKAYARYSAQKCEAVHELLGNGIEMDNAPLNDETLRQMEGEPTDDDESDREELDNDASQLSQLCSADPGLNQMKNLYATRAAGGGPASKVPRPQLSQLSIPHYPVDPEDEDDIITVVSSPPSTPKKNGGNSEETRNSSASTDPIFGNEMEDEENSDVEIIDEVTYDAPNVGTVRISTSDGVVHAIEGPTTSTNYAPANGPGRNCNMTNGSARTYANAPQTDNRQAISRRNKRKAIKNSTEDYGLGINEDLTRKRPRKEITVLNDTGYKLKDFAGSEKVVEEVCKLLMHLKHPEIYRTLGVTPPRGFLLHGPPGTGKTLLANAIAGELQMPMLKIAGTELVSGISGESESNIRELFNQAVTVAPCIIFIDEIDSVTPKRDNVNKEMERRIVAQLLACVDDLGNKEKGDQVLLIGATNRVEAIDTALRRAGRFDREICLGIPDESSREKILSVICRDLRLEPEFRIADLAKLTPGYVGADLQALVREAAVQAVNRQILLKKIEKSPVEVSLDKFKMEIDPQIPASSSKSNMAKDVKDVDNNVNASDKGQFQPKDVPQGNTPLSWINANSPLSEKELQDLFVIMKDFEFALKHVQPSSKREGFATVPDTTWDDIGALKDIRDELEVSILGPVKHADAFKKLGLTTPAGVLLCGPPGCGKTLLAKAVANEAGINFISVKGPELLNMYVGESERAVRQCFLRARNSSPCVIFFDELDALCPRRSEVVESGSGGRVVNQLLTEMDGMESRQGVFIMAATNRPDIIDPAILRPGRLDKILFVNLPTPEDRHEILKALTKNSTRPVLSEDVNLEEIAKSAQCENYTGADLSALVREASIAAFRDLVLQNPDGPVDNLKVYPRHFTTAFAKTKPSVSKEDRAKYKKMAEKYSTIQ